MLLNESKSLLAKLMATENLTVEQRPVSTASFNVEKRILTVPVLDKNISGYLYDMFIGHEVGHALYTPLDGLYEADKEGLLSIANVVEDSRIERKIKNKYPGIRSCFVRGYNELIEKDFFGTSGLDLNDLNFIDRANMFTKGGATQGIKFNAEEMQLINEIESTQNYEDVLTVSRKIKEYLKKEAEEKQFVLEEDEDGDIELESVGFDNDEEGDFEETESTTSQNSNSDDKQNIEESQQEGVNNLQSGHLGGEHIGEDIYRSMTNDNYRQNESKLFCGDDKQYYYGNIPNINLSKVIVDYKTVWSRYKKEVTEREAYMLGIDSEKFQKLRIDTKKIVGYLAKEFELRKNADQMKRASISKTGDLNMNKIYSYKFAEDIFKKVTVVPGGKSHGLVMFLDWSGSMANNLENTFKQLLNLIMFCKKVNIPYEVYAFTSEYDERYHSEFKEGDIAIKDFNLLNLFSSKMTTIEFKYACEAMCHITKPRVGRPYWLSLGGTPLNESIISAMKIVPEFQKSYKLQNVNIVFLTDGEGSSTSSVFYTNADGHKCSGSTDGTDLLEGSIFKRMSKQFIMRDPITKVEEIAEHNHGRYLTQHYLKLLKARTNCNVVGFYILSGRDFGREMYHYYPRALSSTIDKMKSDFRKNKSMVIVNAGYDEYYLLRAEGLDTDEDVEFTVKENATTRGLVSAFSKFAGNRLNNRVILNRFIGMLA